MNLSELRKQLDRIDDALLPLLEERMKISEEVAAVKKTESLPLSDPKREEEILSRIGEKASEKDRDAVKEIYRTLFTLSKNKQKKILGEEGKIFGLLGHPLTHSRSKEIHSSFGLSYALFDLAPEEVDAFLKEKKFDGINVTIPYKKTAMPYCDELSDGAKAVGCVNTVVRIGDRLVGDNTDLCGFRFLLDRNGIDCRGKKVLVLGSGASSGTVSRVLSERGAREIVVVSRTGKVNYENVTKERDAEIIVNTTPVGTFPHEREMPLDPSAFPMLEAAVDLIYQPLRTEFLLKAERSGIRTACGLSMLVAQAAASLTDFTGRKVSLAEQEKLIANLKRNSENLVLIGMPGCGKTTVGQKLAEKTGRPFFDLDRVIENAFGESPEKMIREKGEAYFREKEALACQILRSARGCVIACGGGTVLNRENVDALKANGRLILLSRSTEKLEKEGRPLSLDLKKLENERKEIYASSADLTVSNEKNDPEAVETILKECCFS